MSRSYTPSHGRGLRRGPVKIALLAAAAVVAIGGVAGAVTLTGGSRGSVPLASSLSPGSTAPGTAPAASSLTAVANVTPPVAATDCATPSTFTYGGTLSVTAPGVVKYQWVYSSGQPGPVQTLNFTAAGNRPVTGASVTAKTAGGGWGELKVISPVALTSERATYKLLCGGSSVDGVTVTAAVTPAAKTASCATAAPSFSAAGSITAPKAETVTYYWAQSNGKDSAPATLTFAGPGTKLAAPLTITPPASGTGEAVLVVTSPVSAASAPATYTLTCKASSATATSGPTSPASGPAARGNSPTTAAGSPTTPASNPTTPASDPTTPQGNPSTPASTPSTAQSSPPGNSGNGSMSIPSNDNLNATLTVGDSIGRGTAVVGGVAPYTWSISGLPSGITQEVVGCCSTDVSGIVGTAQAAGTFPFTVTVTDSEQPPQTLSVQYTLTILQPNTEQWSVESIGAAQAVVGTPYSSGFGLAGQTGGLTVTWAITSGSLPPGLSLNTSTGAVTGTPTEQGYFVATVVATDVATGATKQGGAQLTVYAAGTVI